MAPVVTPAAELCIPRGAQGRTALLLVGAGSLLSAIGDDKLAASGLDSFQRDGKEEAGLARTPRTHRELGQRRQPAASLRS